MSDYRFENGTTYKNDETKMNHKQWAWEFFQDSLAKFVPDRKDLQGWESEMFRGGFMKAVELLRSEEAFKEQKRTAKLGFSYYCTGWAVYLEKLLEE
jgi:hypothetical protein